MPMTRAMFRNADEFAAWAEQQFKNTGDDRGTWQDWFINDMPKSYPAVAVFFWMERAGLTVSAWVEYVYPSDFNPVLGAGRAATKPETEK